MKHRHLQAIFGHFANRAPDGPGGGGGGGGGNPPNPNPPPDDSEGTLLRMVNAAVTSQLGRKLESAVSTAVSAAMAPVLERLSAQPAPPPGDDKSKDKDKTPDADTLRLQNELKALKNQIAEKDNNEAKTVKKHREEQLVAKIREGLSQAGVKKELMEGAVATVRARMKIDDKTGAVTYTKQNQGWTEELEVDAGLKDWTDSDTGKAHLAPLPVGGGGTNPVAAGGGRGQAINPATLPADPKARAAVLKAHKVAQAKLELRHHAAEMIGGGRIQLTTGPSEEES